VGNAALDNIGGVILLQIIEEVLDQARHHGISRRDAPDLISLEYADLSSPEFSRMFDQAIHQQPISSVLPSIANDE
jgi:hypothetical protein